MKYLKLAFASLVFAFMIAGPATIVATPAPVSAACDDRILGIPPWYRGLTTGEGQDCKIEGPGTDLSGFITKIAINLIEMAMVIVGYIALFFILIGGFRFITGGDNPGSVEKARNTILHAVIGLAISLGAVVILNLIYTVVGT